MSKSSLRSQTTKMSASVPNPERDQLTLADIGKLLKAQLDPINSNILSMSNDIKVALETAKEASSMANAAMGKVNAMESRIVKLESALQDSRNEQASRQVMIDIFNGMKLEGSNIQMAACHRFGPRLRKRPICIVIKFVTNADRSAVWANRIELRGTGVWAKEDYPDAIENRRQILWPYLRAAREGDPANPNKRNIAYMNSDKLVVNNQTFTTGTISMMPPYILNRVAHPPCVKSSSETTVFFTISSELSNFHPCHINIDDHDFNCVEQYICYRKAHLYDTADTAEEILSMNNPLDMKKRVKRLKDFNKETWAIESREILKTALNAKFCQNEDLQAALLSTGDDWRSKRHRYSFWYWHVHPQPNGTGPN